jgi:dienelactone hydrolase
MEKLMGKYFNLIKDQLEQLTYPMSFLADKYADVEDVEKWQEEARAEVRRLLNYNPPGTAFDTKIHDEYVKDGLVYRHISYAQPYGPRTEGILMRPENAKGKLPGFIGLHDHGGFKYYGKEKITAPKNPPPCMKAYQEEYYGGRAWAHELAAKGYIVFVPDLFLWGSRKIQPEDLSERYKYKWQDGLKKPVDSDEYIAAYNDYAGFAESDIAKTFIEAGMAWPGVTVCDDMRAVDFLLTHDDVDAGNIGCAGLSGGGLRTVLLAAMDERIKASCCVGFMSTSAEFALYKVFTHTWMMYIPGLTNLMDFSDLYSLHGKKPTMVMYDIDDPLYTPKGQEDADKRLKEIYAKMGSPELYSGHFFPGPHKFDVEMQEIAFDFFDKWLKP